MENLFLKYMDERFEQTEAQDVDRIPGPVITISRVCGCSATLIAEMLTEKINKSKVKKGQPTQWRWINKEIMAVASQELKIHPTQVKEIAESNDKNFVSEIVSSFTETYYAHSTRVKKVIEEVIREIAYQGNVVIVGRASGIITSDIAQSLHVNLEAPLSWRINFISSKRNLNATDAKKYVLQMDKQRAAFKEHYLPKNHETPEYDLSLNCKTLSLDQICEIIYKAAVLKNLL
ncbi:MAG: cytidylate kinase-like family protein [Bacteroidales bacterium]